MMMAIARKPSRIAYSVVVWPSSRSRSSPTAIWSRTRGRIRSSCIWEVPPPGSRRRRRSPRFEWSPFRRQNECAAHDKPKGGFSPHHRRLAPSGSRVIIWRWGRLPTPLPPGPRLGARRLGPRMLDRRPRLLRCDDYLRARRHERQRRAPCLGRPLRVPSRGRGRPRRRLPVPGTGRPYPRGPEGLRLSPAAAAGSRSSFATAERRGGLGRRRRTHRFGAADPACPRGSRHSLLRGRAAVGSDDQRLPARERVDTACVRDCRSRGATATRSGDPRLRSGSPSPPSSSCGHCSSGPP